MKSTAKAILMILGSILFILSGCITTTRTAIAPPQEVLITIQDANVVKVEQEGDQIQRSMQIPNQQGSLSHMSFICGNEAYIKLFSALTVGDVSNLWNDICVLRHTEIRSINLFINSPGGDAFSGLALADQIERAKGKGFHITAHASGIVASAALPAFAVCNERMAAPGTIFMVHETSIWKWPGRETASDIRSQSRLMDLIRERYMDNLARYTDLSKEAWQRYGEGNHLVQCRTGQRMGVG